MHEPVIDCYPNYLGSLSMLGNWKQLQSSTELKNPPPEKKNDEFVGQAKRVIQFSIIEMGGKSGLIAYLKTPRL